MDQVIALERELAKWVGCDPKQIVACSSGTAALHLALEAHEFPCVFVATADYNMVACARAISLASLVPLFTDVYSNTLLMRIQEQPSSVHAIIATHLFGRRVDIEQLRIGNPNAYIVEDLAEAHGITPTGDAACWSFYKNKIVAGEEGGAVYFRDVHLADRARMLRCLGFTEAHDYTHIPRGHNYRLANLLAAPIRESLHNIDKNIAKRRRLEALLDKLCPAEWKQPYRHVPWVYDVRIPGLTAEMQTKIVRAIQAKRIPARFGFKPMSVLDEYWREPQPESLRAMTEVFYLPLDDYSVIDAFGIVKEVIASNDSPGNDGANG